MAKASLTLTEKVIFFIPVAIAFGILAVTFYFIASSYYETIVFIPKAAEEEIIFNRFFSSPSCFTYQDPYTQRAYLGIIDKEKFNQLQLNNCYNNPQKKNVELSVQVENQPLLDPQKNEIKLRSENFRNRHPKTITRNILLKDKDQTKLAKLKLVVESE